MKKTIFIYIFLVSCKSDQIIPRAITTDCNSPTPQSIQMQPKDATCYQLRFVR